jgi:hypothetical protein
MSHADRGLAFRLEALICAEFRRLAEVAHLAFPRVPAESVDIGGGVALWLGDGSPVNQAVGLGMNGPVAASDLEHLEAFYHGRGADAVTSICPLADPSLLDGLGNRGWRATEFEHLLVLELTGESPGAALTEGPPGEWSGDATGRGPVAGVEVRVCTPAEREIWARVATQGFSDDGPPSQGHEEFGHIMAARDEAILVLAWVEGRPAGTGALVIDGGVGWLSGDSTLPPYRRRGIQQTVQRYRLLLTREAHCDLAVTEAAPGSGSQRNMERLGFRIAYTHVEFAKPRPR